MLLENEKAQQYCVKSGLTYTGSRPGSLKAEPATGEGVLTPNYTIAGTIHRADVAQLAVQCLFHEAANNKILSAVDRNMTYSQAEFEELNLS